MLLKGCCNDGQIVSAQNLGHTNLMGANLIKTNGSHIATVITVVRGIRTHLSCQFRNFQQQLDGKVELYPNVIPMECGQDLFEVNLRFREGLDAQNLEQTFFGGIVRVYAQGLRPIVNKKTHINVFFEDKMLWENGHMDHIKWNLDG